MKALRLPGEHFQDSINEQIIFIRNYMESVHHESTSNPLLHDDSHKRIGENVTVDNHNLKEYPPNKIP